MLKRDAVVLTDDVRVIEFTMDAGERLAWHYHTDIEESVFCLAGEICVSDEQQTQVLRTGQQARFAAGKPHALKNISEQSATYLVIQHGRYDFIECDQPHSDF